MPPLRSLKKLIHLVTVTAFSLQILAPFSPSFAMKGASQDRGLVFDDGSAGCGGRIHNHAPNGGRPRTSVVGDDAVSQELPQSTSFLSSLKSIVGSALKIVSEGGIVPVGVRDTGRHGA